MRNNFETEFWQLTGLAKKYGFAARVLNNEIHRQKTSPADVLAPDLNAYSYLLVPSLHLSAHALECMAKACAYLNGVVPPNKGMGGHDLNNMLRQPYAARLRHRLSVNAEKAADALKADAAYSNLDWSCPAQWIETALQVLGDLHHKDGSKLRYGSKEPDEQAPSSPLVADTVYLTTQELGANRDLFV